MPTESAGSCRRTLTRSETVMSSSPASALAAASSLSDIRRCICLGRLFKRRLASLGLRREAAEPPQGRGGSPARSVAERGRGGAPPPPAGAVCPRRGYALGTRERSRSPGGGGGGQELFRVLCTRNRPLALFDPRDLRTKDYASQVRKRFISKLG